MELKLDNWTAADYAAFLEELKSLADEKYREFHSSLVPAENRYVFLGVRMPKLRELGKAIAKGNARSFLEVCGDRFYEESMVRGIVTGLTKPYDYADFSALCRAYAPFVSNWALCDCFCSGLKHLKKYKELFLEEISTNYIPSQNPWEVRIGLVLLLNYYLDDEHINLALSLTDSVRSDEYYVKMAQAWLVATALAKCPEPALEYLKSNSLDKFTQNKAIQKARESFRVDDKTKEMLLKLKI